MFRGLNGKVIQIKHVESELYLTLTIKRKENRIMSMFFGDKNRYSLNKLIDYIPEIYSSPIDGSEPCTINVHFEPKESINPYWKVHTSPISRDVIYLESTVSKVKLLPMHLQSIQRGNVSDGLLTFDSN